MTNPSAHYGWHRVDDATLKAGAGSQEPGVIHRIEELLELADKELKTKNAEYDANIREFYKNPPWRSEIKDAVQQHHK